MALPGRVTAAEVQVIVETIAGADLNPYIDAANELVTELCEAPAYGYSNSRLKTIELWLSAHFYCIFDPRKRDEMAGPVREVIEGKVGLHLDVTRYGQQAMILDTAGGLAAWNNAAAKVIKMPAVVSKGIGLTGITWLGTPRRSC